LGVVQTCSTSGAQERAVGIECTRDQSPLAVTVCGDRAAQAAERRTTAAYLALYFSLDEAHRVAFRTEHVEWWNRLSTACAPPPNSPQPNDAAKPALAVDCVTKSFKQRSDAYRKRLSPIALEEANLSTAVQRKIQKRLVELKFLPGNTDGRFGANTRVAIKSYQASIGHPQGNFLTAEERAALLAPTPPATAGQQNPSAAGPAQTSPDAPAFALGPPAPPGLAPGAAPAPPPPTAAQPLGAEAPAAPASEPAAGGQASDPRAANVDSRQSAATQTAPPEPPSGEPRALEAAPARTSAADPARDDVKQSSPAPQQMPDDQQRSSIAMLVVPYLPLVAGVLVVLGIGLGGAFLILRLIGRRRQSAQTNESTGKELRKEPRKEPRLPTGGGGETVPVPKTRLELDGKTAPRRTISA
jgi:uncharacterized protein YecT (DUF1311 family)